MPIDKELASIIIMAAATIAAAAAACFAAKSAREAKRGINTQILWDYKKEYTSRELFDGMKLIRKKMSSPGSEKREKLLNNFEEYLSSDGTGGFVEEYVEVLDKIDNARRIISHRCSTLKLLEKTESLDKDFIDDIVSKSELDFFTEYVVPLDKKVAISAARTYDSSTEEYVTQLLERC